MPLTTSLLFVCCHCCGHNVLSQGLSNIASALLALHQTMQLQTATHGPADNVWALMVSLTTALAQVNTVVVCGGAGHEIRNHTHRAAACMWCTCCCTC